MTNIVFPIFDNLTQLDFAGPAQFLARIPDAKIFVASSDLSPVQTDCGFAILPNVSFIDCPKADLICVPGGPGVAPALSNTALIDFVRTQASGAQWITSVCTGAFILGAAGLLKDKRASSHWGYTHLLHLFGAIHEQARVVKDGNLITAGGVTSGIDFALEVIATIAGEDTARAVQLGLEYDPKPPFSGGNPETSPAKIVDKLREEFYIARSAQMESAVLAIL
jgi:cyclohexyl-isocyanide hydratase